MCLVKMFALLDYVITKLILIANEFCRIRYPRPYLTHNTSIIHTLYCLAKPALSNIWVLIIYLIA